MLGKTSPSTFYILIGLLLLAFASLDTFAQTFPELQNFNQTRISYHEKGMMILGGWAVGNMIWGGIAAGQTNGQAKAFHQMNLYWNSVNLVIAGFGYWQSTKENAGTDFWSTMDAQQNMEKISLQLFY